MREALASLLNTPSVDESDGKCFRSRWLALARAGLNDF
jgi:hypothetical protein